MKKATFTLIITSILFLLLYGCSGGGSGGSNSTDGGVNSAAEENLQPVADGGDDQTVFAGDAANLDGSGSYDPDKNYPLIYDWQVVSKPEGSTAILSVSVSAEGSDGSQASIETDVNGDYVIQLVVTDNFGLASEPGFVVNILYNLPF